MDEKIISVPLIHEVAPHMIALINSDLTLLVPFFNPGLPVCSHNSFFFKVMVSSIEHPLTAVLLDTDVLQNLGGTWEVPVRTKAQIRIK